MKMEVGLVLFLTISLVCPFGSGQLSKDEKDKLFDSLDKQAGLAVAISNMVQKDFSLSTLTDLALSISDIGSMMSPYMKTMSTGIKFLKDVLAQQGDDIKNEIKQLGQVMSNEFRRLNKRLDDILDDIKNEFKEQRLLDYRIKIANLQNKYDFYAQVPSHLTLNEFINACTLSDMSNVLNEFHILLTSNQERSIRSLMNFEHLPSRMEQYSKLFVSLFAQARTLRTLCLTTDRSNDTALTDVQNLESATYDRWFDDINKAITEDFRGMSDNWLKYAEVSFTKFMDKIYDKYTWTGLVQITAKYMNEEYNKEPNKYSWGVAGCNDCELDQENIGFDKGAFKYLRGDSAKGIAIAVYGSKQQTWKLFMNKYPLQKPKGYFYIRNHLGAFIRVHRCNIQRCVLTTTPPRNDVSCDRLQNCWKFSNEMTYDTNCKKNPNCRYEEGVDTSIAFDWSKCEGLCMEYGNP